MISFVRISQWSQNNYTIGLEYSNISRFFILLNTRNLWKCLVKSLNSQSSNATSKRLRLHCAFLLLKQKECKIVQCVLSVVINFVVWKESNHTMLIIIFGITKKEEKHDLNHKFQIRNCYIFVVFHTFVSLYAIKSQYE